MQRLRILLVIPNVAAGGAETQLAHLALGLARRGHDVTLATLQRIGIDRTELEVAGVELVELRSGDGAAKARTLPALVRLARRADVVHCGLWDASLFGRLAAIATRTPVTVAEHSADRSMQVSATGAARSAWIARHHRLLAPFTAATVACGRSQLALLDREGVPRDRVALVPNGVPVGRLRAAAAHADVSRAGVGVPAEARLVIHVGRLTPEKNQAMTLDAVAALRHELGDVHAVFVGAGADDTAVRRAQELEAEWAHFLGSRSDVPALLTLADLAVLPSVIETLPMAALEAIALGVPQVTSDVGDLPDLIAESGGGRVVPARDVDAFVRACRELLADGEARAAAADAAWRSASRWDVKRMVDAYEEILAAAAARRPVPAASRAWPA